MPLLVSILKGNISDFQTQNFTLVQTGFEKVDILVWFKGSSINDFNEVS